MTFCENSSNLETSHIQTFVFVVLGKNFDFSNLITFYAFTLIFLKLKTYRRDLTSRKRFLVENAPLFG